MIAIVFALLVPSQLGPVVDVPGQSDVSILRGPDGRARIIAGALFELSPGEAPLAALEPWHGPMGLEALDRLEVLEDVTDALGQRHVRLARIRHAVPVVHDQVRVHFNEVGVARRIELELSVLRGYVHRGPSLTRTQAIERARQGYSGALDIQPQPVPVLLGGAVPRLAYRVFISYPRPGQIPYVRDVYVDARDGRVLKTLPRVYTQALTMSDEDLDGISRDLRVTYFSEQDSVAMQDSVSIPSNGVIGTLDGSRANVLYTTPDVNTSFGDPTAVTVHHRLRRSVEFFESEFGWTDWDFTYDPAGPGGVLVGIAHEGVDLNNAYFTVVPGGSGYIGVMAFGDGDGELFTPLARCQDVVTHELGHGLINATANLTYQFQSGALNEHFADVFGWLHDGDDDGIGEECIGPALSTALRDMCQPGSVDQPQPANMSEYEDLPNTEAGNFGGVHINSGIPNRAACLTRDRIGARDLSRIWFRALRFHLGSRSDFAAMVEATVSSCDELSLSGATCEAVADSWSAVGLGEGGGTVEPIECPPNSTQVGEQCYCDFGYSYSADSDSCVPEQVAPCPSNSHRQGTICVCDECYQGRPDQNGTGCSPIPGCTVCESPVERSGESGCECIPGIVEVCGERSLEFETVVDGQTIPGELCCQPDDPCGWAADGICDCFGECSWNAADCGSTTLGTPECAARDFGNCGNENWAGRCEGNTLIYCDDQTDPSLPFIVYGDCAEIDRSCGFDSERQIFACLEVGCSLPPEGVCDGNVARWCASGVEASLDCGERPCQSYTIDGSTLNFCYPCSTNSTLVEDRCVCNPGFVADSEGECVARVGGEDGDEESSGGCAASTSAFGWLALLLLWRRTRALTALLALFFAGCAGPVASRDPVFVPPASGPDAPYSEVVEVGDLLFLAGKLGRDPTTGELAPGGIQPETRQAMENIQAVIERHGSNMERVVKCTVFLADISEWAAMNAVYTEFFPAGRPARSAVQIAGLGRDARVEIECIAVKE